VVALHRTDCQLQKDLILDKASSTKDRIRDRRTAIQQIENHHQERPASVTTREIRTVSCFGGYVTSQRLDEAVIFTEIQHFAILYNTIAIYLYCPFLSNYGIGGIVSVQYNWEVKKAFQVLRGVSEPFAFLLVWFFRESSWLMRPVYCCGLGILEEVDKATVEVKQLCGSSVHYHARLGTKDVHTTLRGVNAPIMIRI
jgi:hypothetical protein